MMKSIYKITLLFLLFPLITVAKGNIEKQEKSKTIHKEFKVNANAKVALNNKYGNLDIATWDKNIVEIEVTITVKGDDMESVSDKLSGIDIEFEASSNYVSATTIFEREEKSWSFWKKSNNLSYKINYKVKLPKSNSVDLDNDYGSIFLGDLNGKADINCDYGKITVGHLAASNNTINLDYCSTSTIGYMKKGNVNVDYSKITIDEAEDLNVNEDYSTLKFGKVKNINFNADYGSVTINEADNIDGNSDYASMRIGTVYKNLIIETDYGSIAVKRLAKGFERVSIDGQYAGIKINVDSDASFNFELDLQYAGFRYDDDKIEFYKKITKSTKKYYEGKYGKGNSDATIRINSQYGGVSIKENY